MTEPPLAKSGRQEQGKAILRLLEAPSLKETSDKIHATAGLRRGLVEGSRKAIITAQNIIDDFLKGNRANYETERQARENREAAQEKEIARRIEQDEFEDEAMFEDEMLERKMYDREAVTDLFDRDTAEPKSRIEQAELDDELQFEDEMLESKMSRSEELENLFEIAERDEDRQAARKRANIRAAQAEEQARQAQEYEQQKSAVQSQRATERAQQESIKAETLRRRENEKELREDQEAK